MPQIEYLGSNQTQNKSPLYLFYKNCRHTLYNALVNASTAIANFIGVNAFFNWLFFYNLEENHKDKVEKLSLLQRAVFSGNTLIASLGLNFAYVVVHLVTLWGFHLAVDAAIGTTAALSLLAFPLTAYLALAISDAINEIKRNLIYERLKEKKRKKIAELESKLKPLLPPGITLKLVFTDHYKKLNTSNNAQAGFEAFKKSSRTLVLFTLILALEWAIGISTGLFIGSIVTGSAILVIDWRAQRKVSKHDLKIREMNQKIALLRAKYVELKLSFAPTVIMQGTPQAITQARLIALLQPEINLNLTKKNSIWLNAVLKPHLLKIDNFLAIIGITSGYVAFSLITIFAAHEHLLEEGTALVDGLLYGIPSLIALIIGVINIYANRELYAYYQEEKLRLETEISLLKANTIKIMSENAFAPKVHSDLELYFSHHSADVWIEEYAQAPKEWYKEKEAAKKLLRILTMSFLFFGAGLLSATGIGVVIALGIVVAGLDYYVRSGKEEKESELKELQKQQLKLLKAQEILVDNIATEQTVGAIHLQMPSQPAAAENLLYRASSTLTIDTSSSSHTTTTTPTTSSSSSPVAIDSTEIRSTSQPAAPAVAAKTMHSHQALYSSTRAPLLDSYTMKKYENTNDAEQAELDKLDIHLSYKGPLEPHAEQIDEHTPPPASLLLHKWQKPVRSQTVPTFSPGTTLVC